MENIIFAVEGSNNFYKLEAAKTLQRFAEFDFTYFWEQSIEAGRNARKTGRISGNIVGLAKSSVTGCHPYVEACIGTEFSSVVTDCIIAYICHSEGIGLEELWARCISPKSLYERDIFNRISEYKTGRGINQWINIVRMQEYARSKMQFIFETDSNIMLTHNEYRTRKEYFDLSVSVAANETGCPMKEMPSVKKYSPSSLPDSVFMMGRMSKAIFKRLSDVLGDAEPVHIKHLTGHNKDQTALDAFSYIKDMPRPEMIEMNSALEAVSALSPAVYMPDSFKAAIDLEFDFMLENGIYLAKCPRCGRFFVRDIDEKTPYCGRINSSGLTCRQQIEVELGIISKTGEELIAETEEPAEEPQLTETTEEVTEELRPDVFEIPKELEKRCQKVYNLLYKRIGRIMSAEEFREWSKYLSDTKRDLRTGDAEIRQVEEFLDYWENAVKTSGRKKKPADSEPVTDIPSDTDSTAPTEEAYADERTPEEILNSFTESVFEDVSDTAVPKTDFADELTDLINSADTEDEEITSSGIAPAGTVQKTYKPFNPPKYNTVLEAMMDGKYKSDEILGSEPEDDIIVNGKKVTLPNWERISR